MYSDWPDPIAVRRRRSGNWIWCLASRLRARWIKPLRAAFVIPSCRATWLGSRNCRNTPSTTDYSTGIKKRIDDDENPFMPSI